MTLRKFIFSTLRKITFSLLLLNYGLLNAAYAGENSCTYQTYKWNVKLKKAVDIKTVRHSLSNMNPDEIDALTGCSVCQEDQVKIQLPGIKAFYVCKHLAADIKSLLLALMQSGEPIFEVVGYRVGMTRGEVDAELNRTKFSNHSFGIALDINPQQNGLYDQCIRYGSHCRLIRGGLWRPGYEGSHTHESKLVNGLGRLGLKWGGQIAGKQKDFMHFSPSGY